MSTSPEVVIALDVGTTATKAVAFGPGVPLDSAPAVARHHQLHRPAPGHAEQAPDEVMASMTSALADLVVKLDDHEVVGIGLSTAMHGLLGWDRKGHPATPILTWADGRATDQARRLAAADPGLHARTGVPVHPMTPLAKLAWWYDQQPGPAVGVARWGDIKALACLVLADRFATDTSSASGTGMLGLGAPTWDPGALDLAGTTAGQLPELVSSDTAWGLTPAIAARVGLPEGLPVVVGAADGPLGNLGVGATTRGVVGLSLGTSGAVRMVADERPQVLDPGLFCYRLGQRWVIGSAISTGGIVVDWAASALLPDIAKAHAGAGHAPGGEGHVPGGDGHAADSDGYAGPDVAAVLDVASSVPPGSGGVVAVPHLQPARGPSWDPADAAAWLGVRAHHERAHLVRAAIEGVARQLADISDHLDTLEPVTQVRATGGAFRGELWRTVVAGMVDRPFVVVDDLAGTALGAAALAWWALGRAPDMDAAREELAAGTDPDLSVIPNDEDVAALQASRQRVADLRARL